MKISLLTDSLWLKLIPYFAIKPASASFVAQTAKIHSSLLFRLPKNRNAIARINELALKCALENPANLSILVI
ncbi:hypothetical protein BKI52_31390 [marine bacterium AO1-C]|nr:hypothetical protein BKI52_31390 [marine bacterium AO1-C]